MVYVPYKGRVSGGAAEGEGGNLYKGPGQLPGPSHIIVQHLRPLSGTLRPQEVRLNYLRRNIAPRFNVAPPAPISA
jgi:hypothetical protein